MGSLKRNLCAKHCWILNISIALRRKHKVGLKVDRLSLVFIVFPQLMFILAFSVHHLTHVFWVTLSGWHRFCHPNCRRIVCYRFQDWKVLWSCRFFNLRHPDLVFIMVWDLRPLISYVLVSHYILKILSKFSCSKAIEGNKEKRIHAPGRFCCRWWCLPAQLLQWGSERCYGFFGFLFRDCS